jgi:hypothetical protein
VDAIGVHHRVWPGLGWVERAWVRVVCTAAGLLWRAVAAPVAVGVVDTACSTEAACCTTAAPWDRVDRRAIAGPREAREAEAEKAWVS